MARLMGILGGTFDPVHYGHLLPAQEVMQVVGLEQVRFLPNRVPPHREQPWLNIDQRRQLIELAIKGFDGFVFDDRELRRDGPSYMVDTLADLHREFPGYTLCLLMGMDAFEGFAQWHRWQEILQLSHLIVMTRPGMKLPDFSRDQVILKQSLTHDAVNLARSQRGQILLQSVTLVDISATQIRQNLGAGRSIQNLVPDVIRERLEAWQV